MFGRHHHNGRWEARIGRIFGNKYLYLGTYSESYLHNPLKNYRTRIKSVQINLEIYYRKAGVK